MKTFWLVRTVLFAGCVLVAACATSRNSAAAGSSPQVDPVDATSTIKSIIYSDLSKDEILKRLAPYVRVGDKLSQFSSKTGLDLGFCLEGGPGVQDCHLASGLGLVADPHGVIQVIRRSEQTIAGRVFKQMSISKGLLEWKGYARGYQD